VHGSGTETLNPKLLSMDFGDLPKAELNKVKLLLPKDGVSNLKILGGRPSKDPRIYIGCAKWGRKEWLGSVYPKGTPEKKFLEAYAQKYNAVELNATHYKIYKGDVLSSWAKQANNKDFKFCPKVYKGISHFGSLIQKQGMMNDFLDHLEALKENLGPIFLQVPEKFSPARKAELFEFIGGQPRNISLFVELRHPDWYKDPVRSELFTTIRKLKTGVVITDAAGRRDCLHMELTTKTAFIRFSGNDLHKSDYLRIDEWAKRIQFWINNGLKDLYFFMHMHDEKYTPKLCDYLIEKLKN
jgi:uncharacterized protein YecE (DUF72 family)